MILQRLRGETRVHHERIERAINLARPAFSMSDLTGMLARFHGCHAAFERAVDEGSCDISRTHLSGRRKRGLIEADLRTHRWSDDAIAAVPTCDALASPLDLPEFLGTLYVFEGSTLGGQVVARHIEQSLGLSHAAGYSYFVPYGPRVGAMWRAFCGELTSLSTPATEDRIVRSACYTFDAMHDWFAGEPAEPVRVRS